MTALIDRTLIWGTLAAAGLFAVYAFDADAQMPPPPQVANGSCLPFSVLSEDLEKRFKEIELSGGIVGENEVLIIFGTPTGTTWTMVSVTMDTGIACIRGSGESWFQIPLMSGQPV
jgi:hypothetical protein